jgi:hypothetical protein
MRPAKISLVTVCCPSIRSTRKSLRPPGKWIVALSGV